MGINIYEDTGVAEIDDAGDEAMLVGFYPWPEEEDNAAWIRAYAAVAYSYNSNCYVVWKPGQVALPDDHAIIAVEEYGGNEAGVPITDFAHPEKAVYIVGNSHFRFPSDDFVVDGSVYIDLPGGFAHPLYGHQALAVVMHDRYLKSLKKNTSE